MYYLRFYIKWPFLISLGVSPLLERTLTQYLPYFESILIESASPLRLRAVRSAQQHLIWTKNLGKEQKQFKLQLLKWEGD